MWGEIACLQPGGLNGTVVAVNKRTGERIWLGGSAGKPGYSLPVIEIRNGQTLAIDGIGGIKKPQLPG